ncbi:MAG: BMP family ABC transporter substrate-binding protein [Candidatus Baltobacteraceae bacterium]
MGTPRRFTRAAAIGLAATLLLAPAAALPGRAAQQPIKVGFVYVSPIGDAGWSYQHDIGRKQMEKALAGKVQSSIVENVPEGADSERVIRNFASNGYKLIFTTSFSYMNPTVKVAQQFPGVTFEQATGYKRAKNVGTYNARFYEGRYLTGVIAGKMTKSNVIGYVAAFPIPEVVQGINAFELGARSVNPKTTVKVIWVNSWYDPGKEREATTTLISQGADVVTHHTDSTSVAQTAEEKGVWVLSYNSDMTKYAPKKQLTATLMQWGDYYTKVAREVLAGTWKSTDVWGGIKAGMIALAPLNPAIPAPVKALVAERSREIVSGKLQPFTGPLIDNTGTVRVPAGKAMTDDEIQSMDFFVEGVQGQLPSKS